MSSLTEWTPTAAEDAVGTVPAELGAGPFPVDPGAATGVGGARPFPLPLYRTGETGEVRVEPAFTTSAYDMQRRSETGDGDRAGAGTGMSSGDETAMGGAWRTETLVRGTGRAGHMLLAREARLLLYGVEKSLASGGTSGKAPERVEQWKLRLDPPSADSDEGWQLFLVQLLARTTLRDANTCPFPVGRTTHYRLTTRAQRPGPGRRRSCL